MMKMRALKAQMQNILGRAGLHDRLRASPIYDLFWMVAGRDRIDLRRSEVGFYRSLLPGFRRGSLIFDVGANVGHKTDVFLRLGARVVAIEPDQACQGILRQKFLSYRLTPKPVVIIGKAASGSCASQTMWVDGPGSALNTLSDKWVKTLKGDRERFQYTHCELQFGQQREIETVTLDDLILDYGLPFYVKIDVEGHELSVLQGLHRPVPYLSFEVNLPEFRPEGLECIELLRRLSPNGRYNYGASCQDGLLLDSWVAASEISDVLDHCKPESVEVFWRNPHVFEGN